jgi:hypothetical protein
MIVGEEFEMTRSGEVLSLENNVRSFLEVGRVGV